MSLLRLRESPWRSLACGTERSGVIRIYARDDPLVSDLLCAIGLERPGEGVYVPGMIEMTDALDGSFRFCAPFLFRGLGAP